MNLAFFRTTRVSWKLFRGRLTPDITQKPQRKKRNQKRKVGQNTYTVANIIYKLFNVYGNKTNGEHF